VDTFLLDNMSSPVERGPINFSEMLIRSSVCNVGEMTHCRSAMRAIPWLIHGAHMLHNLRRVEVKTVWYGMKD
jgi:hypothetical protein